MTRPLLVFIAEDEPPARERLVEALSRVAPQAQVVACADSVRGTSAWLAAHAPPDLLLLDIQLADGLSLELFRADAPIPLQQVPVIFTTAYDRFALDAFQALAVDYLLKPVSDAALAGALAKARRLQASFAQDLGPWLVRAAPEPAGPWRQRLVARRGPAQFHPLPVARIAQLVSLDKATYALTMDGERYAVEQTLSELETQLDPTRFFRITRQLIVAAQAVRHYSPAGKGRLRVALEPAGGGEVFVSQERAAEFKAWLQAAPMA